VQSFCLTHLQPYLAGLLTYTRCLCSQEPQPAAAAAAAATPPAAATRSPVRKGLPPDQSLQLRSYHSGVHSPHAAAGACRRKSAHRVGVTRALMMSRAERSAVIDGQIDAIFKHDESIIKCV